MGDAKLACDWWYVPVVPSWDALAPLVHSRRAIPGYPLWEEKHPQGTYPGLPLPEPWPEARAAKVAP
jgi:hypothetical protein